MHYEFGAKGVSRRVDRSLIVKVIVLIASCLSTSFLIAQQKAGVTYIIPDEAEVLIDNYLQVNKQYAREGFYAVMAKSGSDTFELSIIKNEYTEIDERNSKAQWIQSTSRYLLVDKSRLPLLFDYDFTFGVAGNNAIGPIGHRDGTVTTIFPLVHHYYSLKFINSTGAILEASVK